MPFMGLTATATPRVRKVRTVKEEAWPHGCEAKEEHKAAFVKIC